MEVPAEHVVGLLGKSSPDKWMTDIITAKVKPAKTTQSPFSKTETEMYLVYPREVLAKV